MTKRGWLRRKAELAEAAAHEQHGVQPGSRAAAPAGLHCKACTR